MGETRRIVSGKDNLQFGGGCFPFFFVLFPVYKSPACACSVYVLYSEINDPNWMAWRTYLRAVSYLRQSPTFDLNPYIT